MAIAMEQQNNNIYEKLENLEGFYEPKQEERVFIYDQCSFLLEKYSEKIFNKDNNTIYGKPIEKVTIPANRIAGFSRDNTTQVRALKIGYMYIIENKDIPNGWDWTGYTLEELYQKITSSVDLQKQIDPTTVYYGFDNGTLTCFDCNPFSLYKEQDVLWRD